VLAFLAGTHFRLDPKIAERPTQIENPMRSREKKQALAGGPVYSLPANELRKYLHTGGLNDRAKQRQRGDLKDDPDASRERGLPLSVKLPQGTGEQKAQCIRSERDHERTRQIFINDKPHPKQNGRNATPHQKIEQQEGRLVEISLADGVEQGAILAPRRRRVNATEGFCCRIQRVFCRIRRVTMDLKHVLGNLSLVKARNLFWFLEISAH
jgi:hypothetical protein